MLYLYSTWWKLQLPDVGFLSLTSTIRSFHPPQYHWFGRLALWRDVSETLLYTLYTAL